MVADYPTGEACLTLTNTTRHAAVTGNSPGSEPGLDGTTVIGDYPTGEACLAPTNTTRHAPAEAG